MLKKHECDMLNSKRLYLYHLLMKITPPQNVIQ